MMGCVDKMLVLDGVLVQNYMPKLGLAVHLHDSKRLHALIKYICKSGRMFEIE